MAGVAATGAVAAVLLLSTITVAVLRLRQAWQAANREALEKSRSATFWEETLRGYDLAKQRGQSVTLRETFVQASARIERYFPDSPATQALQHHKLGEIWRTNAVYDRAEQHLNRALALRRSLPEGAELDVASTLVELGYS